MYAREKILNNLPHLQVRIEKMSLNLIVENINSLVGIVVFTWIDNAIVFLGSNSPSVLLVTLCKRYSRLLKTNLDTPMPSLVAKYNKEMGTSGVMGQQIIAYCPNIRTKKWYYPIFIFLVGVGIYNAWVLDKHLSSMKIG